MAGVGAVDGHPADRVEQHDVVDDRARWRSEPGAPPASVAGPGEATNVAVPRRTWTSSARIDSATSSAVSAPRSSPAGARRAASRSSATPASSRSHSRTTAARVGEATSPTYDASRASAAASASSSQTPWRRDDDGRREHRGRAPRCRCRPRPARRPGRRRGRRSDRRSMTRQPAAEPRVTSAAGDRRRAGHPQDRRRQMRFHVDLQRAP